MCPMSRRVHRGRSKRPDPGENGAFRVRTVLTIPALGLALLVGAALPAAAQAPEPLGIALEGFAYPYAVSYLPLTRDREAQRLAYMDVPAQGAPNGRTVLLLHGRNFPSSYWAPVIAALTGAGYRVVAPDQLGFGKSSKPVGPFTFDRMAADTVALLDALSLRRVDVVAHSMGGMLAVRLARNAPDRVNSLVLEAPIGLEDYRFSVPPVPDAELLRREGALTAEAYRRQLMTSYALFIAMWGWAGARLGLGPLFYAGLAAAAAQALWHWTLIRRRTREGCFTAFRLNHWVGFAVFAGVMADALLR